MSKSTASTHTGSMHGDTSARNIRDGRQGIGDLKSMYETGKVFEKDGHRQDGHEEYELRPSVSELIMFWERISDD